MIDQISGRPGVLAYLAAIGQVAFWTVGYYVVGTLPESYHARKGNAWARINAYHRAAWHFRKYLEYSDDSFGRASLAWCYANLGMPETAVQHYRLAYERRRHPNVACSLAHAELETGGIAAARLLVAEIGARRDELSPEFVPFFADLEAQLSVAAAGPETHE